MYQSTHRDVKLRLELDFRKCLVIAITVLLTVVIPAQVITYNNNKTENDPTQLVTADQRTTTTNSSGQVAGASTVRASDTTDLTGSINLNERSQPFIFLGAFFITLSIIVMGYLIIDNKNYKKEEWFQ